MATKTFEELKQLAIQIRDEKTNKQNTATRIGTQMLEHLDKLEQDYYDKTAADEELKERDEKLIELDNKQGIYNVDTNIPLSSGQFYTSTTARNAVPTSVRKLGLIITYKTDTTTSVTEQFIGSSVSEWGTEDNWKNVGSEEGNVILEWKTDAITTRNQIPTKKRKKGLVISYRNPNKKINNGWVTEQYIADDVPTNVLWGYSERWFEWNYQEQINSIKSDLTFDYKVTYNSNFGTMLLTVPKDIRKQFLVVAYTDSNDNLVRIIRTAPFNQITDGDGGWYASNAWETLVSRKEFDSLQTKSVIMKPNSNYIFKIENKSNGTFDNKTNTITWDESTIPERLKGFTLFFGIDQPEVINKVKFLSDKGIKPNLQVVVESENIRINNTIYLFNEKNSIVVNTQLKSRVESGKTVYYFDELDIPEDFKFLSTSIMANIKENSGQSAYIRILSADIYYDNVLANNLFAQGSSNGLIEKPILFDVNADLSFNKYCHIIDEQTALITVPKGTKLNARDIVIPLKSFQQPLEFGGITNTVKLLKVESEGESNFSELNFYEFSVASGASIASFAAFNTFTSDKENETYYTCSLSNLTNYYGQYKYNSISIRCGKSPSSVLEKDFTCKIKISILDFPESDNLNNELIRIKTDLNDVRKSIGLYSSNFVNPFCGIVSKSSNVYLSDKTTYKIDEGVNEQNEYADLLIAVARVRAHGIEDPEFSIQLITDKTSEDKINITADVLSEYGIKIQSATVSYDEIYNGIVTVNFKLLKQTSDIRFVKVRCTFTTSLSEGTSVTVSNCSVTNLKKSSTIADTLYNLQYGNRPIILQSSGGNKFRLVVSDDGTLSTAPSLPSRMMIMSHSWGLIPYNPSSGWYGNWGLCASDESLDMVHQIETEGKKLNPEFTTFFYRFATFAAAFKNGASWYEQFDCSDLDFDSIFICSFAAGPSDGNWTGFGRALYDCVTNYVCKGKSNVKVYISYKGATFAPDNEMQEAASLFGTELIDVTEATTTQGTGWPWLMPAKPDGTRPIKAMTLPEGANPEDYMLNSPLTHPGNWGFYTIAKKVVNKMFEDFGVENPDPTIMDFETYKKQPDIAKWVDPNYPYDF